MHQFLQSKLPQLTQICQKHRVSKLYAFGSILTDRFNDESDIDLIAEIDEPDPLVNGELRWSLYDELYELFQRKVDMISEKNLKNPFFIQELNKTKLLIYG